MTVGETGIRIDSFELGLATEVSDTLINSFNSLINELSHHYNIALKITQPPTENFANGSLVLGDLEQTLTNFSLLFNGEFVKKSNREYEFVGID